MSVEGTRRELRRLLPEFTAQLEEFRSTFKSRRNPPPGITYGEGILATIVPLVNTYVNEIRNELDELDGPELAALRSVVEPVVAMRRQARESYERERRERRP